MGTSAQGTTAVATTENLGIAPTITLNEGSTNVAPSPVSLSLTPTTNIQEPNIYLKEPDISVGTDQLASAFSQAANNVTTAAQGIGKYLLIGGAIIGAILLFKAR